MAPFDNHLLKKIIKIILVQQVVTCLASCLLTINFIHVELASSIASHLATSCTWIKYSYIAIAKYIAVAKYIAI